MSDNNLKWIPLGGLDLTPANLAPAEKLRKFGFAIDCCEFGSEKLTKTELCIFDVLSETDNPSVLLVAPRRLIYGWYRILMSGIGTEFKVVSGAANEIVFFSEKGTNLFLLPSDALGARNPLKSRVPESFEWDLLIIDEEQSLKAPDYAALTENIPWKTQRLLLITQFPASDDEEKAALASMIKAKLVNTEQHAAADSLDFSAETLPLSYENPVLMVNDKRVYTGEIKRRMEFVDYTINADLLTGLRRRMDLRSGVPTYKYGGNIYEDYEGEEFKSVYRKSVYTEADVADLKNADTKLGQLIRLTDDVMSNPDYRAIIYFCDKNTEEYVYKVLHTLYSAASMKVVRGELFSNADILRKLQPDDSKVYPKILLATDDIGAVGDAFDRVTHVINYELPLSPVLFERRITRHGSKRESDRTFYIFRDSNGCFDSRILDKALYGALPSAFCGNMPSRNVLLDLDRKGEFLNNLISDLRYIESYSKEVDSCYDLIKRVKGEYEAFGAGKITTAKQLAEFSGKLLEKLCGFYGISRDSSAEDISAALSSVYGLCTVFDGVLVPVLSDITKKAADSLDKDPTMQPFGYAAVAGMAQAHGKIDRQHGDTNFHIVLRNELREMEDCLVFPVLYGIWRYDIKEKGENVPFRDFVRIYNDGI